MFPGTTKILIVDDMLTMRKLVKKALADLGLKDVTEADDGETAWPKIEEAHTSGKPFQLIVSDWNMPKMKGLDLLKKVRATESLKTTPFVLLTAEAESAQVAEAVKAGVSNYVVKPFSPQTLNEKLTQVWNRINKK